MTSAPPPHSAASRHPMHAPRPTSSSPQIHAPLLVGLLCFVIQFWRDHCDQHGRLPGGEEGSGRYNDGRRKGVGDRTKHTSSTAAFLSTLESFVVNRLLHVGGSVPFTKPWLVKVLLWIEQRSKSLRQALVGRDERSDAHRDDNDHQNEGALSSAQAMSPPRPLIMAESCFSPSGVRRLSSGRNEELLFVAPNCSPILPKKKAKGPGVSEGIRGCDSTTPTVRNFSIPTHDDDDGGGVSSAADDASAERSVTEPPSSEENAPCGVEYAPVEASETAIGMEGLNSSQRTDDWDLIHRVLAYWFGQSRPEQSQRQLWMIAAQTESKRALVDADIANSFGLLLRDLAENRCRRYTEWTGCAWIDPTMGPHDGDASATSCINNNGAPANHVDRRQDSRYGYLGKIAAIVVLDQFSRHILRHLQSDGISANAPAYGGLMEFPSQSSLDLLACEASIELLERHGRELDSGMIPTPMYVFALMPLRHANTIRTTEQVQEEIRKVDDLVRDSEAMVRRFRTATNRRMAVLQDEARRVGRIGIDDKFQDSEDATNEYTDDDLLECAAFSADLTPSQKHPVHECICAFLANQGVHASSSSTRPVVVSLSGGVDSMVIASVLSYMQRACHYRLKIIAVHIDYGNRPESAAEADFVRRYCQSLGNVEFNCRRIDEVTRGVTARDEYEKISRTVRYEMYRKAIQQALGELEGSGGEAPDYVGVFLGHHRGDLRENVLSNAHRGCGPLDLSGMTSVSRNDGVTLYRPLLPLEKTAIFDYAHRFGVPYFKDTTPTWSTRGKLRNKLIPLLEEVYGEGSMNNLSNLAVESDSCRRLVHDIAFQPFRAEVRSYPLGISIGTQEWKEYDLFFWKIVLREALHSVGLGMFSEKSITSFLERVRAPNLRAGWLQCRKDYAVYLRRDGRVFIFYPESFPWGTSSEYKPQSKSLDVGDSILVGPWQLTSVVDHADSPGEKASLLNRKAVPDMESLMGGRVEYYLEARTFQSPGTTETEPSFQPRPLVFAPFTKQNRPPAWKSADTKLQDKLPLVCCDEISLSALKDPNSCGAVHMNNSGEPCENPIALIKVSLQAKPASRRGDSAFSA